MKKLITVVFVFFACISYSQENKNEYNKKHNLLWDVGINHTSNFKPEFHSAYEVDFFPLAETLFPGYYTYPAFNYKTGLKYRYYFFKNFNVNIGADISYWKSKLTRSIDSINKYYLYPDSIKQNYQILFPGAPEYLGPSLYSTSKTLMFGLNISFGYRYKRFYGSLGIFVPLYEYRSFYREHINNKIIEEIYKTSFKDYDLGIYDFIINPRIEFLVNKKKIPVSIYFEANSALFIGIIVNTTNINFNE